MIIGLGTDIIEVSRISQSVQVAAFKEKVFSKSEIEYCERKTNSAESYAVRFAAKEAFFKALATGLRNGMALKEVEVMNDELGKPTLNIIGGTAETIKEKGIKAIHISLSHTKDVAVATVVLEG
jgi:holo-[acyl-carrier protein] synthase